MSIALLVLTFLLPAILVAWYPYVDQSDIESMVPWLLTLWVGGGALALAWGVRLGIWLWKG